MPSLNCRNLAHRADHVQADHPLAPQRPVFINPSVQTLTRRQLRLVNKNPGTLLAIAKGARIAVDECQFQFHSRRWNCPTADSSHGGSIFGKILRKGEGGKNYILRNGTQPAPE